LRKKKKFSEKKKELFEEQQHQGDLLSYCKKESQKRFCGGRKRLYLCSRKSSIEERVIRGTTKRDLLPCCNKGKINEGEGRKKRICLCRRAISINLAFCVRGKRQRINSLRRKETS